jgi:4-amino-4-deoxy-L-arabinose transferase-like glycosyltransferase
MSDIWSYREFVRAESYFALGSRFMVEHHEWLAPHAPDERQLNKPPLTFWLTGISYKLFGTNYGSARLPSVFAALAVLGIVYAFGARLMGVSAGLMSAGTLASSYLFLTFARTAMSDMLLTLFVTASFACFAPSFMNRPTAFVLCGYVSLALGVLTKGPVTLLLVGLPIGLMLAWSGNVRAVKRLQLVRGILLFLLISVPYFLLVYFRLGTDPLKFFFVSENLRRFTGTTYEGSARPFWFELPAFFSDFAPWSLLLIPAGWNDWRERHTEARMPAKPLLYLWLACAILLFSLSSFKLDYYLLPAMPAAALIAGAFLSRAAQLRGWVQIAVKVSLVLIAGFMLVVASICLRAASLLSVANVVRFTPLLSAAIGFAFVLLQIARRRLPKAAAAVIVTIWATILTAEIALMPAFARYFAVTELTRAAASDRVWYTSSATSNWANDLAFNLAAPNRVTRLLADVNNEQLLAALESDSRAVAVIWEREYNELAARGRVRVLASAETFGHGGLNLKLLRRPEPDRLLLVARSDVSTP